MSESGRVVAKNVEAYTLCMDKTGPPEEIAVRQQKLVKFV